MNAFTTIDNLELMGDLLDEWQAIQDWEAFEADMATNPYDDPFWPE